MRHGSPPRARVDGCAEAQPLPRAHGAWRPAFPSMGGPTVLARRIGRTDAARRSGRGRGTAWPRAAVNSKHPQRRRRGQPRRVGSNDLIPLWRARRRAIHVDRTGETEQAMQIRYRALRRRLRRGRAAAVGTQFQAGKRLGAGIVRRSHRRSTDIEGEDEALRRERISKYAGDHASPAGPLRLPRHYLSSFPLPATIGSAASPGKSDAPRARPRRTATQDDGADAIRFFNLAKADASAS